jgi:alpha-tubulin suppressor-like RCC1 family protein
VAVAAGAQGLSVALLRSGELWSWRYHTSKLEFGPTLEIRAPKTEITGLRQLPPVEDAVAIAVRDWDVLVLDRGGVVHHAKRGQGWRRFDALPRIAALRAFSDAAGALDVHGGVWTWGRFGFGHKDAMEVPEPAKVEGLPRAVAIDVDTRQSLALDAHGGLWVWGPTTTCDRHGPEGETSCQ